MDEKYLGRLRARVTRALNGRDIRAVHAEIRAIVGARNLIATDEQAARAREILLNPEEHDFTPPTPEELQALEELVRALRPSVLSNDGRLDAIDPLAAPSFPAWQAFSDWVGDYLNSIGRIDMLPRDGILDDRNAIGTGFLVSTGLLATNRHVVDKITSGTRALATGQAVVRFRYEYNGGSSKSIRIRSVRGVHPFLDIALLELEDEPAPTGAAVLPIDDGSVGAELSSDEGDDHSVVTIGYPMPDGFRNPIFAGPIFNGVYHVKRAAPGEIIGRAGDIIHHDCSTLGGNSGSPVISMAKRCVVGIHFSGEFLNRNEAVAAPPLRDFITNHGGV